MALLQPTVGIRYQLLVTRMFNEDLFNYLCALLVVTGDTKRVWCKQYTCCYTVVTLIYSVTYWLLVKHQSKDIQAGIRLG